MIKAVIFDMDGVLVDTEPIHKKVWAKFFSKHSIPVTENDLLNMRGVRAVEIIKRHMPNKNEDEINTLKKERVEMHLEALKQGIVPVEGVINFIEKVKDNNLKIAVATSAVSDTTSLILTKLGLNMSIDVLVTADDVTRGKPNPEIYLKTAEKLELEPEECLVFEDAPSGIKAAQAAGMEVVALLTSHKKGEFEHVNHFFNDFNEINLQELLADSNP